MKMKKLKVGIVGCGFIASKWHIPGFQRLPNTVVQAVSDISPKFAASTAKKFNIPKSYSNITEMLQKEDLDIVDICTPPHTHAPLAIEAMKNGCHVLLEKPMALKLSECDEMVNVSHKKGVKLCIIHNELFRPPLLKAKKLVEEGAIGKVLGMQWTRFTHRDEYFTNEKHWIHKLPGGTIGETGPHGVYTSLTFLKKVNDVEVTAGNNLKYPWASFDYFNITLKGDEMISNVIISHASKNYVADINIFGTEGILKLDMQSVLLRNYSVRKTKPKDLALSSLKPARQTIFGVTSNAVKMILKRNTFMKVNGHTTEIELFVDSIVNNQRPPVTAEEGREVIRVMETIVQKLEQKYPNI